MSLLLFHIYCSFIAGFQGPGKCSKMLLVLDRLEVGGGWSYESLNFVFFLKIKINSVGFSYALYSQFDIFTHSGAWILTST